MPWRSQQSTWQLAKSQQILGDEYHLLCPAVMCDCEYHTKLEHERGSWKKEAAVRSWKSGIRQLEGPYGRPYKANKIVKK